MRRLEELIEKRTTSEEETDLGYRSILVSLLARFCLDIRDTEKAVGYLQDYKALAIKIGDNISEHPEVLASKAFAKAFCSTQSTNEVIQLYQQALKARPGEVSWMYGLCLAKDKALRIPSQLEDDREAELETLLRRVVSLDVQHYQARIALAKRLILKEAFEEAEHFINEAKGIRLKPGAKGFNDIGTKLEMLGALHQMRSMSKLYKDHQDRALEFFLGAYSLNNKSERAIHGCAKIYIQKHLSKHQKKSDNDNLAKAKEFMDKLKESAFDLHQYTLASVYSEEALLHSYDDNFEKARVVYDSLIKKNKDDLLKRSENHWNYSTMLRKHGQFEEELDHLKRCVEADWAADNKLASADAVRAQDRLMEIATMTCRDRREDLTKGQSKAKDQKKGQKERFRSYQEALEMKSRIFRAKVDFRSAIFYMDHARKKTLKSSEPDLVRHATQIENLIELHIDASKSTKTSLEDGKVLLKEAKEMIQAQMLPNETSSKLTIHASKAEIELTMKHRGLNDLKGSALSFEDTLEGSQCDEDLKEKSYKVLQASRSALDYSMNHLKREAFPEIEKEVVFPYIHNTAEKLEKKFKEMGFQGISQKYPEVINFVLEKIQPAWVKTFIAIRNTKVGLRFG